MDIKKVTVIGGGTMGNGIAHVFAMYGFQVRMVETSRELAEKAVQTIDKNLGRMVEKEKIEPATKTKALNNIQTFTDVTEGVTESNLIIESVPENFELKKEVFSEIDNAAPEDSILASNTSSISITKLAAATGRPERFIGMHFFNPVPLMPLVELVKGFETNDETCQAIENIARQIDKTPVAAEDSPGFVSNRVLMPMINEAIFLRV